MDLQQFVEAKRKLEWDLAVAIQAEVRKFEEATGQTPSGITVQMVPLVRALGLGAGDRKHLVGSVSVDTPLE